MRLLPSILAIVLLAGCATRTGVVMPYDDWAGRTTAQLERLESVDPATRQEIATDELAWLEDVALTDMCYRASVSAYHRVLERFSDGEDGGEDSGSFLDSLARAGEWCD